MNKIICLIAIIFSLPTISQASNITLPWSTSFDEGCTQDTNYPTDGWACGTNQTITEYINVGACIGNGYQQVSSAANYPLGAGGRGARKFICDGANRSTGHYYIRFESSQTEIWIRFYTRWQPGFKWSSIGWEKFVWTNNCGGYIVAGFQGINNTTLQISTRGKGVPRPYICNQHTGVNLYSNLTTPRCFNSGWNRIYPGGVSDGSWHYFEFHIKINSGSETFDGAFDAWVDGTHVTSYTNVNYTTAGCAISSFELLTNQSSPQNGTPYWQDLDDIAISNSGYIGPYSGVNTIGRMVSSLTGTVGLNKESTGSR